MSDNARFTVWVNQNEVAKLHGVTLSDISNRALLEWNDPDNADLQHSLRMGVIEEKLAILQKELQFIDSRRPLVVNAIARYDDMLKREDERYQYAKQTVHYNKYIRRLSEIAFTVDFDTVQLRVQCADVIEKIKEVNPMFDLDKWAANLKREMD